MTGKKLFLFLLLQWVVFILLKLWLLNGGVFASEVFQAWFYYALVALFSVALVRRFGVISYFEVIFILVLWLVWDLILDLLITTHFTGPAIFKSSTYWYGCLVMILAVMVFHKKRHVHLRKELLAKHHGHH